MKAVAGPQLAGEAEVEPARETAAAQTVGDPDGIGNTRGSLVDPIEITGNREMFGDIAFPWRHGAAVSLGPVGHSGSLRRQAPPSLTRFASFRRAEGSCSACSAPVESTSFALPSCIRR